MENKELSELEESDILPEETSPPAEEAREEYTPIFEAAGEPEVTATPYKPRFAAAEPEDEAVAELSVPDHKEPEDAAEAVLDVQDVPEEAAEETPAAEGTVKTGLAVSTKIKDSTSATADAAGAAEYDVTLAAVTVDDNGVIQSCVIDSIPATINFDTTGAITTDLATVIDTKNEKGENYGMVAWGGAIAEWDAQVKAVAD